VRGLAVFAKALAVVTDHGDQRRRIGIGAAHAIDERPDYPIVEGNLAVVGQVGERLAERRRRVVGSVRGAAVIARSKVTPSAASRSRCGVCAR